MSASADRPGAPAAPDCYRCRAFFVTHARPRPYGCRTFGFESVRLPRDEVRLTTGEDCRAFEPKPGPERAAPPRP